MNPNQRSMSVSIVRPLVFCLLGTALLGYGLFLIITAYPDPAELSRLAGAVIALWAALGFLAGIAMGVLGLMLLVPSIFLLRRRWRQRQRLLGYVPRHEGRGMPPHPAPPGYQPPQEAQFEDDPGEQGYGLDPDDSADSYEGGYGGPDDRYDRGYDQRRGGHCGNGRGRRRNPGRFDPGRLDPGRFDQRRWAEMSR